MTTFIQLSQYQLIEAEGLDAEKYLQGQLTTDVYGLANGASTLTAHCDPKGKMTSIFRLIRGSQNQFFLLIKKELMPTALDALKKYAVFSKLTFKSLDWQIVGVIGAKCGELSPNFSINLADNRAILFSETPLNLSFTGAVEQWEVADIQAGLPSLSSATQNEFIPQALNLQAIEQAISFSKGCYIGQETVARAKYRGANKRAMFILKGETQAVPEIGTEIEMQLETHWRKTGTITSAVNLDGILWLQVVINNDVSNEMAFRLPQDETRLEIQPLPYALI